jgi:hypothetical protein
MCHFYKKLEARRTAAVFAAWIGVQIACVPFCFAQKPMQPAFASPAQASDALFAAVRSNNEQTIMRILAAEKELIFTGDDLQDRRDCERFVQKYEEMHRLVREPDGATLLYVGAENWAFPIPLASKNGRWYFDTDAGAQEILFRKIGENEARAVLTCRALVLGGEQQESEVSVPFHGYYFRVQDQQGTGNKAGSFIVVAYPAEYRSSGVMTFIASQDGSVYERDLGPETAKLAGSISAWQPDASWRSVQ